MSVLAGKNIVLGITGGIAAYKTTFLTRLLVKAGARVKVVMSPAARDFVTPLTLATLSKNPVVHSFVKEEGSTTDWNNHVSLGLWADLMLIAPATAGTLSKMAHGTIDNLLLAVYSSAKCPVFFAPAMDLDMYAHPTTRANIDELKSFGNHEIPAETGSLASGLEGRGRMAEPETILARLQDYLEEQLPMRGKHLLITAGPTYEAIDPVRFIGNHSSGKMGFSLAREAADRGANVTLICGPTAQAIDHDLVKCVDVKSAQQMYDAVHDCIADQDIAIFSAAVSDYRPAQVADQKIKKQSETLSVKLVKNPDILASVGALEHRPFLVGFALETENEEEFAFAKAKKKNCDLMVLNSLRDKGAGFSGDTNRVKIIDREQNILTFETKPKTEVAKDILDEVFDRISRK